MTVSSELCNCIALRQAERHVARRYERAFESLGLTVDRFAILARLDRLGPLPMATLAETLVIDRSTLAYTLKDLVARDLVLIERAERDRRHRTVRTTKAGRALFIQAQAQWRLVNTQLDSALGDRALALRAMLKEIEGIDLRLP